MNIVAVFYQNTAPATRSPGLWASVLRRYCWYEGRGAELCTVIPSPHGVEASPHPLLSFQMTPVSQKGDPRRKVPDSPCPFLAREPPAHSPTHRPPARLLSTQSSGHRAAEAMPGELRTEGGISSSRNTVSPPQIWPHPQRAFSPGGCHSVANGTRTNPSSRRAADPDFRSVRASGNLQQRSHPQCSTPRDPL